MRGRIKMSNETPRDIVLTFRVPKKVVDELERFRKKVKASRSDVLLQALCNHLGMKWRREAFIANRKEGGKR